MLAHTHERRLWWRHLLSILLFPVTMTLVVPALIASATGVGAPDFREPLTVGLVAIGSALSAGGTFLWAWTVVLFDRVGKGTLGLGELMGEPVNLVVSGPYRHVRNPMISGVLGILLGEAAAFGSVWLLLWFATFLVFMTTSIRFWEEPHLEQRYGTQYLEYRRNVPRWIPRISPWDPAE